MFIKNILLVFIIVIITFSNNNYVSGQRKYQQQPAQERNYYNDGPISYPDDNQYLNTVQQQQQQQQQQQLQQQQQQPQPQQPQPQHQRNTFLTNDQFTIQKPYYDQYGQQLHQTPQQPSQYDKPIREQTPYDYVTEFSWNLFAKSKIPNQNGNLILSPILIQSLLSLLGTVATGQTKEQITDALREPTQNTIKQLIDNIKDTHYRNEISFATAMFPTKTLQFNNTFLTEAIFRKIEMFPTDFSNPRAASTLINNWVAKSTNNRIQNLYNPDAIQGLRLLLANTIYFRGFWKTRFNKTINDKFYVQPNYGKDVTMMKGDFKIRGDEFTLNSGLKGAWVEIPYEGNEFSMVVILPSIKFSIDSFIRQMNNEDILNVLSQLNDPFKRLVHLTLPKFKVHSSFSVVNALLQLGIVDLFTINSQLSYLTKNNEFIRVDDVLQQSHLNVDETGSVAAAATSVAVVSLSISSVPEEMNFEVNQPFLALIVDKRNKVPIFIAKVHDP